MIDLNVMTVLVALYIIVYAKLLVFKYQSISGIWLLLTRFHISQWIDRPLLQTLFPFGQYGGRIRWQCRSSICSFRYLCRVDRQRSLSGRSWTCICRGVIQLFQGKSVAILRIGYRAASCSVRLFQDGLWGALHLEEGSKCHVKRSRHLV